jgi:phosphomethylpyrimidine synthase
VRGGPEVIRQGLARGTLALPANRGHRGLKPAAIGAGVRVKINANIGTSPHDISMEKEQAKLAAALEYGADAVMDLSTGGNLDEIRTALLGNCPAPFGTVPIYQVMTEGPTAWMTSRPAISWTWCITRPAGGGLCLMHCGVTSRPPPAEQTGHRGGLPGRRLSHRLDAPLRRKPLMKYDRLLEIARNTTSPCRWGQPAPSAWPTPPIRPSSTN